MLPFAPKDGALGSVLACTELLMHKCNKDVETFEIIIRLISVKKTYEHTKNLWSKLLSYTCKTVSPLRYLICCTGELIHF